MLKHLAAVDAVGRYASALPGFGGQLSEPEVRCYGESGFRVGWRLCGNFVGQSHELHLLIDAEFPYTPPRIALADKSYVLEWPHVEKDGLLCILPKDTSFAVDNPADVVHDILMYASKLIEQCVRQENTDDFRNEFLSYWELAPGIRGKEIVVSLLEPCGPSRIVQVWYGENCRIVAEDKEALQKWLHHRYNKNGGSNLKPTHKAALVWLPKPLLPTEYPNTAADVGSLLRQNRDEAYQVLHQLLVRKPGDANVFLGAPTPTGTCFASLSIKRPYTLQPSGKQVDLISKGFRPGHTNDKVLVRRYLSPSSKIIKYNVGRADHQWIHGRDRDEKQNQLRKSKVAVLGCGSLGGQVCRLLAQAGIGKIMIVDPATMRWENTGRHTLGARSVLQSKAEAVGSEIKSAYPHLQGISAYPVRFGPAEPGLLEELNHCNLIVSAMGNWAGDSYLNEQQRQVATFPPVVYTWVEPHALAAHAVSIPSKGPCLRCGFSDVGEPLFSVIDWPRGGDVLESPACDASFTPYGPMELCWAHALASETAIDALLNPPSIAQHRFWIAPVGRVKAADGVWMESWVQEVEDIGEGGRVSDRLWPASNNCPVCHFGGA